MRNEIDKQLDIEFEKAYLFFQQGRFILDKSFKEAFFKYLDAHYRDNFIVHDNLFRKFNSFWMEHTQNGITLRAFQLCNQVFDSILSMVHEWEDKNQPKKVHKGTPYYFYGTISILKGEIDKGLLLMHQAYGECNRLITARQRSDKTPSICFVHLDERPQQQFFRQKVVDTVIFLNEYISNYNTTTSNSLNINDLRTKFLEKAEYIEVAFFFVYCTYKLEHLMKTWDDKIKENKLASFIETAIIFDLCKLCEVLITEKFSTGDFITKLDSFFQDSLVGLNLRKNNLGFLNGERDRDFSNTIKNLANHNFSHNNFITNPANIEYDLALVYCLRNFGGHKIQDQEIIRNNFNSIVKAALNSLFFIIEKKY